MGRSEGQRTLFGTGKARDDPAWRAAARLIVRGEKLSAVAVKVGKERRTIQRWLNREPFQVILQEVRQEWDAEIAAAKEIAQRRFQELLGASVQVLAETLTGKGPEAVRLRAAEDVLRSEGVMTGGSEERAGASPIQEIRAQIALLFGPGATEPRETLGLDTPPDPEGVPGGPPSGEGGSVRKTVGKERRDRG